MTGERGPDAEDILRRYNSALRRLAWSYAAHPAEREDLFQEIALALWKALPRFRRDSSERTYVYRVAHNTAITFATSRRRTASRHVSVEDDTARVQDPASSDDPERDAILNQRRSTLRSAVRDLPLVDRQIVLLYLEGLSSAEIEAVTGFTAGKIAMRLSRARRRLAIALGDHK